MRKLFILFGFCFFLSGIAQSQTQVPFAEIIKVSAKDSSIKIEPAAKRLLSKIMEGQNLQKKTKPLRLFFNAAMKDENNSMSNWMAAQLKKDLYKVNLSAVISKYIGETEKNLNKVFDSAAKNNLILYFDEADALFGKRTTVKDSHDRYANQEVSYFMNLLKQFKGTVFIQCDKENCIDTIMLQTFIKVGG